MNELGAIIILKSVKEENLSTLGAKCAINIAINTLEKANSKIPIAESYFYGFIYHCPVCRKQVENELKMENTYCTSCGQKLDWVHIKR